MCVLIISSFLFPSFAFPREFRFFCFTAAKQPTRWMILWCSYDVDLFVELVQFNSFQFMWIFILFIILFRKKPERCNCAMVFFLYLSQFIHKIITALNWWTMNNDNIILFEWHTKIKTKLDSCFTLCNLSHNAVFSSSTITWHYMKRPKR